jgi:hypothetical protein
MRTPVTPNPPLAVQAGGDRMRSDGRGLSLSVVATTDEGTYAALTAARTLGAGLNPRVALLVPCVVPHLQPLAHLTSAVALLQHRFRRLAGEAGTHATVQVCICRPELSGLELLLPGSDTVLIGGRRYPWWNSREQRLACRLAKCGHRVLFVDAPVHRGFSERLGRFERTVPCICNGRGTS